MRVLTIAARNDEEMTDFVVHFADDSDQALVVDVLVRYATHWTNVEEDYEIIAECAYAVAHVLGVDLEDKSVFKISHPHGSIGLCPEN